MSASGVSPLNSLSLKKSASPELRTALASGDASLLQQTLINAWSEPRSKLQQWPVRIASLLRFDHCLPQSARSAGSQQLRQLLIEHAGTESAGGSGSRRSTGTVAAICRQLAVCLGDAPEFSQTSDAGPSAAVELLIAAEFLVLYPEAFSADDLWVVYERLATWSSEKAVTQIPADMPDEEADRTLWRLLVEAEIPLVLSLMLAPFQHARELQKQAQECLEQGLEAGTDTDGSLAACLMRRAPEWLGGFLRTASWSLAFEKTWCRKAALHRWTLSVEWLSGLLLKDGFAGQPAEFANARVPVLEPPQTTSELRAATQLRLLQQAIRTARLKDGSPVPRFLKRIAKSDSQKRPRRIIRDSDTSACSQSDWGMTAVMRNCWRPHADLAVLDWDTAEPTLSLATLGSRLIQGTWHSRTTVNGQPVTGFTSWSCTCWFADSEVAFAELLATSDSGLTQIRHVMLSLRQHLAILTDTITTQDPECQLTFESRLPLASQVAVLPDPITRELQLRISDAENSEARVSVQAVPAWLDDDRVQHALGQFAHCDQQLHLSAQSRGGLTVPLILDWHPDRLSQPADWNRLTVTEDRRLSSAFDASGFRIRRGGLQLLLYRSLRRGQTLRAVLGYHTACETMYGRVNTKGRIDPLVVVESAE